MSATATYQNLGIRLFVSRKDFLTMLDQNWIFADLYYRGDIVAEKAVYVSLSDPALQFLREVYAGELAAIDVLKRQKQDEVNERIKNQKKEALLGQPAGLPDPAPDVPAVVQPDERAGVHRPPKRDVRGDEAPGSDGDGSLSQADGDRRNGSS